MLYTADYEVLSRAFVSGANKLCNNKIILNDLNVFPVPDGDTGSNMSMTISAAVKDILSNNYTTVDKTMSAVASASLRGARGNSGVILSQIFRGMSRRLAGLETANAKDIAECFKEGVVAAYKAVMKPMEGTILSVARDTADAALEAAETTEDIVEIVRIATCAGQESLARTPELLPQLKAAGVVDSGGQGLVYILEGALEYLETGKIIELNESQVSVNTAIDKKVVDANIKFLYCTEFLINKGDAPSSVALFRDRIEIKGDCMVVIDDDDVVKVHIHTNNPGYVIEEALKIGELINIKIDNMKYQHDEGASEAEAEAPKAPAKEVGFAAVAAGDGLESIFLDMGVDKVIKGGQTMNPSTDDILSAVEAINAKTVFILPNNKNIIMAAKQVVDLTETNIVVLETRSVPEGISARLAFDPAASIDDNIAAMNEAIENTKTGSVTYSVRNFTFEDKEYPENTIMGLAEGKISVVGDDSFVVLKELLEKAVDDDSAIISIYLGGEIKEEQLEAISEELEELYPDLDVLVYMGGQPLYDFIYSVE
ncbi:MAG: DAK2 domain-containing protein [Clostridia bacterium]|nr:DAK2 domain-containing protein [Clostridia bacterium]